MFRIHHAEGAHFLFFLVFPLADFPFFSGEPDDTGAPRRDAQAAWVSYYQTLPVRTLSVG
jgi:hypothetical protein